MRQSNFELLRIFSILLIIAMHFYAYAEYNEMGYANRLWGHIINVIGNTGVSLFILISGFWGIRFKLAKIPYLIIITMVYTMVAGAIEDGVNTELFIETVKSGITYKNWFISCYILLLLFSPYINDFCASLSTRSFLRLLCIAFIVFSIIPTFTNSGWYSIVSAGGKSFLYILYVYCVGRFLVRLKNYVIEKGKLFLILFSSSCCALLGDVCLEMFFGRKVMQFCLDCSPFMLISSLCVFLLTQNISIHSTAINYVAKSVFPFYLLHGGVGRFLNKHFFVLNKFVLDGNFILMLMGLIIVTITCCFLIDQVRLLFVERYVSVLSKKLAELGKKLGVFVLTRYDRLVGY